MGRALAITKRQAKTFIEAAREANGEIRVNTPIGVITFSPVVHNDNDQPTPEPVDEKMKGYL